MESTPLVSRIKPLQPVMKTDRSEYLPEIRPDEKGFSLFFVTTVRLIVE
jgi:hypothetical protein